MVLSLQLAIKTNFKIIECLLRTYMETIHLREEIDAMRTLRYG